MQTISKKQLALFWKAFQKTCQYMGLQTSADREDYRKRILKEECNLSSIKLVNKTYDFEALMVRLAGDSNDYEMACKYLSSESARTQKMIEVVATQIMQLTGRPEAEATAYIVGIARQAKLKITEDSELMLIDVPARSAKKVFYMLETHRRRLLKRYLGVEAVGFYGFNIRAKYTLRPPHGIAFSYADNQAPKLIKFTAS